MTEECVVCYNETKNRLKCNHIVCQKCEQKLNTNDKIVCPYCRRVLPSFKFTYVETLTGYKKILLKTINKYIWTKGYLKHLNEVIRHKYTNSFLLLRYRQQMLVYLGNILDYRFLSDLSKTDLEYYVYREVLSKRYLSPIFVKELFIWFLGEALTT